MIKLYGFPVSNYTQMVHFALLEKGLEFVQEQPSQEPGFKAKSPMGKVPCIETDDGFLSETPAILGYLEQIQPTPALMPSDPFAAAKARELLAELIFYVELSARRHYQEVFFKGERNRAAFDEVKPVLGNALAALNQLGKFDPFICGSEFTAVDIVAAYTFCYAQPVAQAVYGWDIIAAVPGLQEAIDATHARDAGIIVGASHSKALEAFAA
ncbi:MAG TPA: glutathione S-transferase family protein [Sneathiellales bacterium]|nr:glutathione S-transferase family protein [Sneathiellales bacterium]